MVLFILLFIPAAESSAFSNGPVPDSALAFADFLFNEEQYEAAVREYRRYIYFHECVSLRPKVPGGDTGVSERSDSSHHAAARDRMIEALLKINNHHEAVREARRCPDREAQAFNLGRVFYDAGQRDSAVFYFGQVTDPARADRTRMYLGLTLAKAFEFEAARRYLALPAHPLGRRSPVAAGILAAVPGVGQAYAGRWGDGAYALLMILTGGAASYYYYKHDESLKFTLSLTATSIFYVANVYSAIVAAKNYNLRQNYSYLREIEEGYPEVR